MLPKRHRLIDSLKSRGNDLSRVCTGKSHDARTLWKRLFMERIRSHYKVVSKRLKYRISSVYVYCASAGIC